MSGPPANNWAADADKPDEPAPPLIAPTGNSSIDVMADVVNRAFAPFQNMPGPEKGDLAKASTIANGVMGMIFLPLDLLNTGFALLTKDIAKVFPPLPAATLGMLHVGWPHAHMHPPSFIPPAPPVPLPSLGPVMLAGCISVLINGVPAARSGDIGFSVLCGTFTPPFEVFTGSSKVFFGGARAARMLDVTMHCMPGGGAASKMAKAMKYAGAAIGVAGIGAQGLKVAQDANEGKTKAAVIGGIQAAADAAALALSLLMGLDPGVPPCIGALVAGHPNVLVGGFPMPPWFSILGGLAKLGKGLKPKPPTRKNQNNKCRRPGEPVDPVTGAHVDEHIDYEAPGPIPFRWGRSYSSADAGREGPVGRGFRHTYEHGLAVDLDRVVYTDPEGAEVEFLGLGPDRHETASCGYVLRRRVGREQTTYEIATAEEPTLEFVQSKGPKRAPRLVRLIAEDAHVDLLHDDGGRLIGMVESSRDGAMETRIDVDERGHIIEVRRGPRGERALPRVVAYEYDHAGRLVAWEDALGARGSHRYDAAGRVVRKTDRNGYSFDYAYDDQGRCVEERGEDGLWHVELRYEPEHRRTVITTSDGAEWIYAYDKRGTVVSIQDPYGGALTRIADDEGKVVREDDPEGQPLTLLYDETGRHHAVADRFGHEYPPLDELPTPPDPREDPVPETPLAQQWGAALDDLPETYASADALPPAGLLAALADLPPPAPPAASFDALGRIVEVVDEAGHRQSFAYDACGNPVRHRDRDGREHKEIITSWNLLGAQVDPLGHRTDYDYTPDAQVARILDPGGNESRYEYDLKGRLVRVLRHGAVHEAYVYDRADRLVEKRDGAGNVLLQRKIGGNGLPSECRLASGEVFRYAYDRRGRLTRAASGPAEVQRAFDQAGRRVLDARNGRGVTHFFDDEALYHETTTLDRFTVRYRRTQDGALLLQTPVGGVHRIWRGERGTVHVALGNGTRALSSYDHEGRCRGHAAWRSRDGKTALWSARYTYSAEGELRCAEDSARGVTEYSYDAAHRLAGESHAGAPAAPFVLDEAGNIREKPGLPPVTLLEGNRLRAAGRERFHYNTRDHLASHDDGEGATAHYHYNSLDMLASVSWSGWDEAWTATYDGLGRRTTKALGGKRTTFTWDGDRIAAEVRPDGALRIYVYPGQDALVPLMFIDYDSVDAPPGSGRPFYLFGNAIGVPLHIEDQEGNIVWWADHVDPYGAVTVRPGATVACALRFPGHYFDDETGLHDNRYRSYSPRLGRYLQSDPAGQAGGINLYAYPANPLVHVDVLGLTGPGCGSPSRGVDPNTGSVPRPGPAKRVMDKVMGFFKGGWKGLKGIGKSLKPKKKTPRPDKGKGRATEPVDTATPQDDRPQQKDAGLTPVPENTTPVPNKLTYVWFGGPLDKDQGPGKPSYLDNIKNAVTEHNKSPKPEERWPVQVVISKDFSTSPEVFDHNVKSIKDAGAIPVVLEDTYKGGLAKEGMWDPIKWEMSDVPHPPDTPPNYGAASDVVRAHILKTEGGAYSDTDNVFIGPLPASLVPKYGFLAGAAPSIPFDSAGKYLAWINSKQDPVTALGLGNAFMASTPDGQVINAYWNHIRSSYDKYRGMTDEARMNALREDIRGRTMHGTGPSALMKSTEHLDQVGHALSKDGKWAPHSIDPNQDRIDLVLDPKLLWIPSAGSWLPGKGKGAEPVPRPLAQEAAGEGSSRRPHQSPLEQPELRPDRDSMEIEVEASGSGDGA